MPVITFQQVTICLSDLPHLKHAHLNDLTTSIHHLTFEEHDDSSIDSNPIHDSHVTSADEEVEEHFPAAPLSDDVWMEEPVPDRHLCINEHSQHDFCPYPCPYSLD